MVDGQRAIQTTGDPLLGWCTLADWRGVTRDFYVRQLWDGKGSVDLENVSESTLLHLGRTCGRTLAKAHARTGNRFVIAEYLGQQEAFETAVADFASAYAELNEQDYRRFVNAVGAAPVPDPA